MAANGTRKACREGRAAGMRKVIAMRIGGPPMNGPLERALREREREAEIEAGAELPELPNGERQWQHLDTQRQDST